MIIILAMSLGLVVPKLIVDYLGDWSRQARIVERLNMSTLARSSGALGNTVEPADDALELSQLEARLPPLLSVMLALAAVWSIGQVSHRRGPGLARLLLLVRFLLLPAVLVFSVIANPPPSPADRRQALP